MGGFSCRVMLAASYPRIDVRDAPGGMRKLRPSPRPPEQPFRAVNRRSFIRMTKNPEIDAL